MFLFFFILTAAFWSMGMSLVTAINCAIGVPILLFVLAVVGYQAWKHSKTVIEIGDAILTLLCCWYQREQPLSGLLIAIFLFMGNCNYHNWLRFSPLLKRIDFFEVNNSPVLLWCFPQKENREKRYQKILKFRANLFYGLVCVLVFMRLVIPTRYNFLYQFDARWSHLGFSDAMKLVPRAIQWILNE